MSRQRRTGPGTGLLAIWINDVFDGLILYRQRHTDAGTGKRRFPVGPALLAGRTCGSGTAMAGLRAAAHGETWSV